MALREGTQEILSGESSIQSVYTLQSVFTESPRNPTAILYKMMGVTYFCVVT